MKLYRGRDSFVLEHADQFYEIAASSWDEIVAREDLYDHLHQLLQGRPAPSCLLLRTGALPSAARKSGPPA